MSEQISGDDAMDLLRSVLDANRPYKEATVAEGGVDARFVPHLEICRHGEAVATLLLSSDSSAIADAIFMSVIAYQADTIVLTFDGWQVHPGTRHPDTGQEWTPDLMQDYVDRNGRDNGLVTEQLVATLLTANGRHAGGSLPYVAHPSADGPGIVVDWGDPKLWIAEDKVAYAGGFAIATREAFARITDYQGELAALRGDWPDLTEGQFFAHLDCSATFGLQRSGVAPVIILQSADDDHERREIIEQRMHRPMVETVAGALTMELRSQAAVWN